MLSQTPCSLVLGVEVSSHSIGNNVELWTVKRGLSVMISDTLNCIRVVVRTILPSKLTTTNPNLLYRITSLDSRPIKIRPGIYCRVIVRMR